MKSRPKMRHPATTPLEQWTPGWLKMEVANLLDVPGYLMMHDHEKKAAGYPVSDDEMRALIKGRKEADALLAGPSLIEEEMTTAPLHEEPMKQIASRIEADMVEAFGAKPLPRTTLAYRSGQFVSLPIDDNGKVIEPPARCPKCGPVLLCPDHMPIT